MTDDQRADLVIDATGNNKSMVRSLEFAAFAVASSLRWDHPAEP